MVKYKQVMGDKYMSNKICARAAVLAAALALAFSSTSAVWAKAIPLADDAVDYVQSADADDVAEGWKLHQGFVTEPGSGDDPDKDADRRFSDYIFADYGGEDGVEEAYDRADERWGELEDDDSMPEEEKNEAWMKIMVEEIYENMGKKLYWGSRNLYLTDGDGVEQEYDGEGITVRLYLTDREEYDSLTSYFGDFEFYALHEKFDGESYEYEKLPVTLSFETVELRGEEVEAVIAEFTTKSLSPFGLVLSGVEEEAPKTADNMMAYIGLVAISLAAFATFGVYIRQTRR